MMRDALSNCEHYAKVNRIAPHCDAEKCTARSGFHASCRVMVSESASFQQDVVNVYALYRNVRDSLVTLYLLV